MRILHLNLISVALLSFCNAGQISGSADLAANEEGPDAFCLIQWQVSTEVAVDSDRPKKAKRQKLENFNCGDYAWCSGLKNTVQKVTELRKTAPANIVDEDILEPFTREEEKAADLHKKDEIQIKLDKAQDDVALSEKALTAAQESAKKDETDDNSGEEEALIAKWKRFAKKLTKDKQTIKTTVDDFKAENQLMKENMTRITRDKEQAQEVALVIANQWRNNARSLTNTNKELLANITRLTAEKQQLLGELEKVMSDRQRVVVEKDEAAVDFQRTHESDHGTLEQWKQYADRLTNEKQQMNDAIAKLSSEKTNLEGTITSFNQALPKMPMENGSEDSMEIAQNVLPESSNVPISYAQQPSYQHNLYPSE